MNWVGAFISSRNYVSLNFYIRFPCLLNYSKFCETQSYKSNATGWFANVLYNFLETFSAFLGQKTYKCVAKNKKLALHFWGILLQLWPVRQPSCTPSEPIWRVDFVQKGTKVSYAATSATVSITIGAGAPVRILEHFHFLIKLFL